MTTAELTFDPLLRILAIAISVLSAFVTADLIHRVHASKGLKQLAWLASAAFTMAAGVYSTTFIGLLSYQLAKPPSFDVQMTVLSGAVSLLGSAAALLIVRNTGTKIWKAVLSGLLLATTIVGVQHMALASVRMEEILDFQPLAMVLGPLFGVLATVMGMIVIVRSRKIERRIGAAFLLGLAIVGVQALDTVGAFVVAQQNPALGEAVLSNLAVASSIAGVVFMVLFMALTAATFDRRYAEMSEVEADKLRKANDFTTMLINSSVDGVFAFDRQLVVTAWNSAMARLTGVSAADAIGRPMIAVEALRGPAIVQAASTAIGSVPSSVDAEITVTRGSSHWVIQASPVVDAMGNNHGGILFVHDDTEERKQREAMRQSQRLEALGHMLASVAHDFSNLLVAIIGSADLLEKNRDVDRHLPTIKHAAGRGRDLVKKLVAFSRRQQLRSELVAPAKHLVDISELLKRTSPPDVGLSVQVDEDTWSVLTDPSELEIALLNLTVNARDAMPNGGQIGITARNVSLDRQDSELAGDYVEFRVSDTGVGMSPDIAEKAFEPYFTTKDIGHGTGLGLSQVYGFARQSGGTVSIETAPGRGTTVSIWLPKSAVAEIEVA